ncbi:hypothetical protein CFN78_13550 [Amycolatopsis antarctica]|uniref:DUF6998 domain-containing protein n=1 Tax=Amycolatopsis antarctica TaxID=1854586 RepID=A0A263D5A9_9PSEU|nr:hypothetical protein [Amycolatopsis antarctica]OZM72656.1 hypothetical protein CFN78_13550 [Amycolatopsis antarctica]
MNPDGLSDVPVPELLGRYAAILQELRRRDVVRTQNAPLGDYAEYLAARVYQGELAANSAKSYDLLAADGQRIQVKARTVGPGTQAGTIFSVFRSFDFDVAVLITFDSSTYGLRWAREVPAAEIETASRYSSHVNGNRLLITTGAQLGTDVTPRFSAALAESPDPPAGGPAS